MTTRGFGSCVLCALACGCAIAVAAAAHADEDCLDAIAPRSALTAQAPGPNDPPRVSDTDLAVCALDPYCAFPSANASHR
jgi:hypothetical protein